MLCASATGKHPFGQVATFIIHAVCITLIFHSRNGFASVLGGGGPGGGPVLCGGGPGGGADGGAVWCCCFLTIARSSNAKNTSLASQTMSKDADGMLIASIPAFPSSSLSFSISCAFSQCMTYRIGLVNIGGQRTWR